MGLRMRAALPSFEGIADWMNGEARASDFAGRPVLVHFWSISCYMCHDKAQALVEWRAKYEPQGLYVVSIHQPRSAEELDVEAVRADAAGPMQIGHPCAIDNGHTVVDRFENAFVPAYYVFNREHQLRHFQAGDKGYERIATAIERVLEESPEASPTPST